MINDHTECALDFQRERDLRDAYQAAFGTLKLEVERFLYKANFTPPWQESGAVWAEMVKKLNNGLVGANARIEMTKGKKA